MTLCDTNTMALLVRAGCLLLVACSLAMPTAATHAQSDATGEVIVDVTNLRSTKGLVQACMTTKPKAFPNCQKDPDAYSATISAGKTTTLAFKGVKPGRYAIALLHDENSNNKADMVLGMMPKEGFGFSRDAKVRMGPPKFKSAAFDFLGQNQRMTIKMRYML